MITIERIDNDLANKAVKEWHRHNKPVPKMQITFSFGIWADSPYYRLVGVVIVGEPCGRPKGKERNLILNKKIPQNEVNIREKWGPKLMQKTK